ncbi:hypothetical protein D9613_012401 [Agrocybe pediades]|uniref:Uncharacterized protein n=1 Tax=Agrocybe pediades TaxID=84607 RepID=A0A8H4VN54_9AGAR|nr:hypothetical protein D9613_012401 [Agrocybe pediades]
MGSVQDAIALTTSNICSHIMKLEVADRQTLTALLKWDPSVSDRLTRALQYVKLPWQRLSFEEDYALILRDLETTIQRAPLIWAEVAAVNIRLDSLSARIAQVAPRSHLLMGHSRSRSSTETSLFHDAQQIMINGGTFTIHSAQNQNTSDVNTNRGEIDGESPLCIIRRILVRIKRIVMIIVHSVEGAVRRGRWV